MPSHTWHQRRSSVAYLIGRIGKRSWAWVQPAPFSSLSLGVSLFLLCCLWSSAHIACDWRSRSGQLTVNVYLLAHRENLCALPQPSLVRKIFFLAPVCCLLCIIFQLVLVLGKAVLCFGSPWTYKTYMVSYSCYVLPFLLCIFLKLNSGVTSLGFPPFFLFCASIELHTYFYLAYFFIGLPPPLLPHPSQTANSLSAETGPLLFSQHLSQNLHVVGTQ